MSVVIQFLLHQFRAKGYLNSGIVADSRRPCLVLQYGVSPFFFNVSFYSNIFILCFLVSSLNCPLRQKRSLPDAQPPPRDIVQTNASSFPFRLRNSLTLPHRCQTPHSRSRSPSYFSNGSNHSLRHYQYHSLATIIYERCFKYDLF